MKHPRIWMLVAVVAALAALAAAWQFGPLADWLNADSLARAAAWLRQDRGGPLWVIVAYVVAALTALPLTVMVVLTAMLFEPVEAVAYALCGTLAGGGVGFALGHVLGSQSVARLAGSRLHELSQRLARRGVLAVFVIRLLPIAPFAVINIVAGASHIRWRDFLLGTALGVAPGILAMTMFLDRLIAALQDPSPGAIVLCFAVLAAILAGVIGIRRWVARSS